jgi:hypothetical protein
MLICRFSTPRCGPVRIRRYLEYLEAMRADPRAAGGRAATLDRLIGQARSRGGGRVKAA